MAKGDVTMKFDAETAKFIQSVDKARAKLQQTGDAGEGVGKKFRKTEKDAGSLGKSMIETFTGPLTAIGLFATAVASATALLKGMNDERERGAKLSSDSEMGLGQLAQLAGGDAKKLQHLIDQAKKTYSEGGSATLDGAAKQIFTLESAGELKDRKFWSDLYGKADQESLIKASKTLQFTMGKEETGSLKDLTSKAFAASKGSAATKVGPLLVASSRSAAFASGLGLSDEEVLAGTSVVSTGAGSAELGGTQMSSFLKKLGEKEEDFIDPDTGEKVKQLGKKNKFKQVPAFKGLSLRQSIEKIRGKDLTLPQLTKFLGDSTAVQAFNTLDKQLDTKGGFSDTLKDVHQAEKEKKVHKIIASAKKVPALRLPQLERIAKAKLALAEMESFSPDEHEINTNIANDKTDSINRGEGGLARNIRAGIQETSKFLGASPQTVKNITEATDTISLPGTEVQNAQKGFFEFLGIGAPTGAPRVHDSSRNIGDEVVKPRRER